MIMTVKAAREMPASMESVEIVGPRIGEKKSGFLSVQKERMEKEEVEVDQESGGSWTEDVEAESQKSVGKFGRKRLGGFVHNQVLRVREEDLLLKEDIDADRKKSDYCQERHVNVIVLARPILPCSPLSGKKMNTTRSKAASH